MVPLILPGPRLGGLVALRLSPPTALLDRMLPALLHRVALLNRDLCEDLESIFSLWSGLKESHLVSRIYTG